jgi:hypothetical protein
MRNRRALLFLVLLAPALALFAATYRGNTQSRVFHQSSCRYYTCRNCTATFASAAEARQHGYRPCGICEPGDDAPRAKAEETYSGNTRSRKFHSSACRYASCTNCTAKFRTRQEAIDAGYSPSGCCRP